MNKNDHYHVPRHVYRCRDAVKFIHKFAESLHNWSDENVIYRPTIYEIIVLNNPPTAARIKAFPLDKCNVN